MVGVTQHFESDGAANTAGFGVPTEEVLASLAKKPGRSRARAKKAGAEFERVVADVLKHHLQDDGIDRQVKTGAKDLGDIRGVKLHGMKIAIEVKNTSTSRIPEALQEAEVERGNLDALAGVVISKRHGIGHTRPLEQLVSMTLGEFISLLTASRAHYDELFPEDEA
jgi:hypothetical protein